MGSATGILFVLSSSASAFSFTTHYDAHYSDAAIEAGASESQVDLFLKAVTLDSGTYIDTFSYVQAAQNLDNDFWSGGNTGAASADIGDYASTGIKAERVTSEQLAFNLSTNNLSNIIDTEDNGRFAVDLNFSQAIDNLLIWERGKNSRLGVQALQEVNGELVAVGNQLILDSKNWGDAGFNLNTQEIGSAQRVGSLGLNVKADLGVDNPITWVRFFSDSTFNGPDWKFVGTAASEPEPSQDVPEPGALLGLGLLGIAMLNRKLQAIA